MLSRAQFVVLTALAALGVALAAANMALWTRNRALQAEVNARASYIQQSVQLEGLYREIVKALADLAVRSNDGRLREVLGRHGVTLPVEAPAAAPSPQTRTK
jgi:hypothetical protein